MGQTKAQRIVKQLAGNVQKQTPIASDMFLPNHSGIAVHPETLGNFLKLDCSNDPLTDDLKVEGKFQCEAFGMGVAPPAPGAFYIYSTTTSAGPIVRTTNAGSNAAFFFVESSNTWGIGAYSPADFKIMNGANTRLVINSSGNFDFQAADLTTTGDVSCKDVIVSGSVDGIDIAGMSVFVTANSNHRTDNTQAHTDYLLNSGADIAVGPITITADNSTADQAYVPMVLYNTDDTPPAASGFPIGTLYVQYTA